MRTTCGHPLVRGTHSKRTAQPVEEFEPQSRHGRDPQLRLCLKATPAFFVASAILCSSALTTISLPSSTSRCLQPLWILVFVLPPFAATRRSSERICDGLTPPLRSLMAYRSHGQGALPCTTWKSADRGFLLQGAPRRRDQVGRGRVNEFKKPAARRSRVFQ